MYLVTVLLIKLAVGSANVVSVLDVPPIEPDCKPPDVCATLYFYDAAGQPLGALQGTEKACRAKRSRGVCGQKDGRRGREATGDDGGQEGGD